MEMPQVGTDFAGYQVQGIIGRGGMSVVYQAEHPRLARVVALKVLSVELSEDDRFRERFVRESRLAASLDHPNIIPIYDAGASEGLLFIAMRFVKGDLKSVIQREGRLRPERLMPVFSQIASALDAAHRLDLVHRDVKPANVLIAFSSGPDGRDHVYLADFGLTKHATSRSGITGTGQFVGTVDYMAPEQIEGKQVDGRVDVYALGCIAYECLTGRVPFTRDTDAAVIWAHLKEDPPKVSSVAGNVPPEVDDVIGKAMAKSVDDRYDSCMKLLVALREAMDLDPVRSQRASVAPPPRSETVFRERSGEVAVDAPVPPSTVFPPAASSQPASFAPPPQTPSAQEAPVSQAGVAPWEGRSEVSPPTPEPTPPEPVPLAQSPLPVAPPAEQSASRGRKRGRGRLLGLVALVAVLLVGGGVLAYMLSDDSASGGGNGGASEAATTEKALIARTTTDLSPVGPFPDTVESLFLVAHIGPKNIVMWNCQRNVSIEDSIRGLSCVPGEGISQVQYSLFHDGIRMRRYFGELEDSKGASGVGDCVGQDSWRGFWSIGPEVWGHALGANRGDYKGQVLCFKTPTGEPHIAWIDYSTKIFAEAFAPPGGEDSLYYWWKQAAGPGHPTHIHSLETGNTAAIEGQNVVSGSIVAVGTDALGKVTSATVRNSSSGKETEIFFDNNSYDYECPLFHVQEHKVSGAEVILPVERVDGKLMVTYFNHCGI